MREWSKRPGGARGRTRPGARGAAARPGAPDAARPAARRSTAGRRAGVTRTSAPRPAGRATGRAAILTVVLVALALSYVIPLRTYLAQQAEISQLRARQEQQRAHIAALEEEAARWADDDYIRIQARKRRHMVEPGQIPLITIWETESPEPEAEESEPTPPSRAWWDLLWSSVQEADRDGGPEGPQGP
ncbi:MAG: septum formation initiator family protein [Micromonosporaceae bacterium]|jgi:cell division protein FtsB